MAQDAPRADRGLVHVGVGFKPEHAADVLESRHAVAWLEVHAENYMGAGGPPLRVLEEVGRVSRCRCMVSGSRSAPIARSTIATSHACADWSTASSRRRFPNISPGRPMTAYF